MYMIFGTSKEIAIGPAAIMALMTGQCTTKDPVFAVLLAFTTGLIIISMGLLKLGR